MSNPKLLTEREAAEVLSLKPDTLRRWRWSGGGPPFRKLGRAVRYAMSDLAGFAESAKRESTSQYSRT